MRRTNHLKNGNDSSVCVCVCLYAGTLVNLRTNHMVFKFVYIFSMHSSCCFQSISEQIHFGLFATATLTFCLLLFVVVRRILLSHSFQNLLCGAHTFFLSLTSHISIFVFIQANERTIFKSYNTVLATIEMAL